MLDEKLVPPAFIINAIPGADKLARAATAARAAIDKAGVKAREAGEAARATSTFHIGDPANRPARGVSRADFDAAIDAYHSAWGDISDAETAHRNALRKLHDHVREGMKAPAFIDAHETLYATASQRAKDALDSLVAAIRERDMLAEDVLHRRILTPHGWAGLTFHSSHLEAYVTANVADDDALAWQIVTDALSESYALQDTKRDVLRACIAVRERTLPAEEKRAEYRRILAKHHMSAQARR